MKISYNWLKQYLPIDLPPAEVATILTNCGLEVESMEIFESMKGGLKGLVVGEVKTCVKHPNADKLKLTSVDIGNGTELSIVCGGPNVAAGQKVIVATVGAMLFPTEGDPFEIKKSKIRGEVSEGMICAEDEIGLGISHEGVLVLPNDIPIGTAAKDYFKVEEDTVFEIGLTPNRVDAASHIGVARDLEAVLKTTSSSYQSVTVKIPSTETFMQVDKSLQIQVEVEDSLSCPRYAGLTVSEVTVGESPAWLKNKLKSIGVGPINNIVDITNFVLHECGQPLHAFDANKVRGKKIVVRSARPGEKFITLDKIERTLVSGDLMICDAETPMCIAGVFGGLNSGISNETKNIFLESALFNAASIRKTSKHHGLKTDASFRFERGADPAMTLYALKRAAMMMCEIAGGKISSEIVDVYRKEVLPASIRLEYEFLDRFSGVVLDRKKVRNILDALRIKTASEDQNGLLLIIPTGKVDVTRPADVVEEILRVYGYNNIPLPSKLNISIPSIVGFDREKLQNKISDYLVSNGFNEMMTNSMTRFHDAEITGWKKDEFVSILNPLSQDLQVMRQGMIYSGLEIIEYNQNRKSADLKLFEFGKTYSKSDGKYNESSRLALFMTGKKFGTSWTGDKADTNFYFLKSFVKNIIELCGIDTGNLPHQNAADTFIASGMSVLSGNKTLVRFGQVRKTHLKIYDISHDVYYADFDWDLVIRKARRNAVKYEEVSKFPPVRRDLSMMIDQGVSYAQIETIAYNTERKLLREVNLFDVYEGEKITAGKKSYALTFILQDDQQTLTDKQIDKTMDRLMAAFEKEAGAMIRKS